MYKTGTVFSRIVSDYDYEKLLIIILKKKTLFLERILNFKNIYPVWIHASFEGYANCTKC